MSKRKYISRTERRQRITEILSIYPGSSPAEIAAILTRLGVPSSAKSVKRDCDYIRQEGWRWMDETARSGYLCRLRVKYNRLIDSFDQTHAKLLEASKNPEQASLIASLGKSLCAISAEIRETQADIELRAEWMHKFGGQHNPEWLKAAKEADPHADKALR